MPNVTRLTIDPIPRRILDYIGSVKEEGIWDDSREMERSAHVKTGSEEDIGYKPS
jgi:hypothetical protein